MAGAMVLGTVWLMWPDSGPRVVPGTVQAMVLTSDEVSVLVGTTLISATNRNEPPSPMATDPANCAVAVGPATQSVYARGWTAFLATTYQDSDAVADHTVTQVLGTYPDSDRATKVFRTLTDGINGCTSAVRTDAEKNTTSWVYTVEVLTADTLVWTATQDAADQWTCYRQARLTGKTVLQVAVCQAADGTEAATKIIDQFVSRAS